MSKAVKIECDYCKFDLTYTTNCVDYYLTLSLCKKTNNTNISTLMHIEPPINGDMHFCDVRCLKRHFEN